MIASAAVRTVLRAVLIVVIFLPVCTATASMADFGADAILEDFEDVVPYGPALYLEYDHYCNMAIQTPLLLPSGIIIDRPVPSVSGTFGP